MKEATLVSMPVVPNYRLRMALLMLVADTSALSLAAIASNWVTVHWFPPALPLLGPAYGMFLLFCMALFLFSKLYPGIGINPANEIRLVFQYTFTTVMAWTLVNVFTQPFSALRPQNLLLLWAFSVVLVLGLRWGVRINAVQLDLWKEPVLIIAQGKQAADLTRYFHRRLRLGFAPAVVATDEQTLKSYVAEYGEIAISIQELPSYAKNFAALGIRTAIVDLFAAEIVLGSKKEEALQSISDIILVSDLDWLEGAALSLHDFEGVLGIEARKKVLSKQETLLKEWMDFSLSLLALLFLLPIFVVSALIIKLDSPGPVFYVQKRIGKHGRIVNIIKFRTMVQHAEEKLQAYLTENPAAKAEWDEIQKLKQDPRITRSGHWLRRLSLDELPQLINVLKGEMSLVGPRPILPEQLELYGDQIGVYCGMKPGITGLWQVSGRNGVSFKERVRFDVYYVRNWSIWLDVYILLRTVWVVLFLKDAY